MKRKIINIDEAKCNGCGLCVSACPEGAIKLINGKARLVSDFYCDGLGACIGHCPEDAITIEEREAENYNEKKAMENIVVAGKDAINAHIKHLNDHNEAEYLKEAVEFLKERNIDFELKENESVGNHGCPGSKMMFFKNSDIIEKSSAITGGSELQQWPIQLHLMNPHAPYLKNADFVIAADCVPFAFPNFHNRFLKGKILTIFCPKLDHGLEEYMAKLTEIFTYNDIKSITLVHMQVPCCFGLVNLVEEALKKSGKNIIVKEYTISIRGEIL
jgi:NAD-dependent dihydropyrimidine dehydrogenase PreA subunit